MDSWRGTPVLTLNLSSMTTRCDTYLNADIWVPQDVSHTSCPTSTHLGVKLRFLAEEDLSSKGT